MRLKTTVLASTNSAPNTIRAISTVSRARSGLRHRAHERLVRVADVRVDHVEVPLVDRHVDRLADRAAGVVQPRRRVRELHEVAEVLDRPVPAAAVEVADERRAVGRREDRPVPAEDDVVRAVPGDLGELRRRRRLDERAAQAAREPHPLAVDGRACVREELERVGRAVELDARPPRGSGRRSPRGARAPRRRAPRPASSVRVRNGTCSTCACSRAAWRAARPPLRLPRVSVMTPSSRRATRPPPAAPAGRLGRAAGSGTLCAPGARTGRCRAGSPSRGRSAPGSAARPRSRPSRPGGRRSSISARAPRSSERDPRAGPGGVAGRGDVGGLAVRARARARARAPGRCGRRTPRRAGSGRRGRSP